MKTCQLCGGPNAMEIKLAEVVPAVICPTCLMSASPRKLADRVVEKTHDLGPDRLRDSNQ